LFCFEFEKSANLMDGPVISTIDGIVLNSKIVDVILHLVLIDMFLESSKSEENSKGKHPSVGMHQHHT